MPAARRLPAARLKLGKRLPTAEIIAGALPLCQSRWFGGTVTIVDSGPEVHLRSWFNDPYNDAISAARTCYSSRVIDSEEVTEQQRENIGPLCFEGGHHTVYQHATFEFGLSGI